MRGNRRNRTEDEGNTGKINESGEEQGIMTTKDEETEDWVMFGEGLRVGRGRES